MKIIIIFFAEKDTFIFYFMNRLIWAQIEYFCYAIMILAFMLKHKTITNLNIYSELSKFYQESIVGRSFSFLAVTLGNFRISGMIARQVMQWAVR